MKRLLLHIIIAIAFCLLVLRVNWLLSHISLIGAIGVILIVLSAVHVTVRWPIRAMMWPGIILTISSLIGCVYTAMLPPGGETTVDVDRRPQPMPRPVGLLESLHRSWDSTAYPNWPVAELLALVSERAYLTPVEAEDSYRTLGFDSVEPFTYSSMIGYVVSCNDDAVIAFRGTDDRADWFVNLDALTSQTLHGEIHKGFFGSYQQLKPQIVALLKQIKPKHLWITGHSLGGALALTCAYDFVENEEHDLDGVITFGQPMVARRNLAEYLGKVLFRRYAHYVNDNDIVPRVAPGYAHCGSLVWFTGEGVKVSQPQHGVVVAAEAEKAIPSETQALRPLSNDEFDRLERDLRRANTLVGKKHVLSGTADVVDVTAIDANEYASFSEKQFEQVKADLQREHIPTTRRRDGSVVVKGSVPWLRDHSMTLYTEKIQTYFGKTESK